MTQRSSVRAAARENYVAMAAAQAAEATTPLPNPPRHSESRTRVDPSAVGGGDDSHSTEPDLTARVRALYEDSAVPVVEIARLCGVTERTIYKHAAKGGWTKRYRRSQDYALAKGAGGRFIRRDDRDKPFAHGLQALDPAGRARAGVACNAASQVARVAQARALSRLRRAARLRAIDALNGALAEYARYRQGLERAATLNGARRRKAPAAPPPPSHVYRPGTGWEPSKERVRIPPSARPLSPAQAAIEQLHLRHVEAALACWQNLQGARLSGPAALT